MTPFDKQQFFAKFSVPPEAEAVIDSIVSEAEQKIIAGIDKTVFSAKELATFSKDADVKNLYRRGIINIAETDGNLFSIAGFWTRLDIFVITEHEIYTAFPKEIQKKLDSLYFEIYYSHLNISSDERPTDDAVLTRDEACAFIDREARQLYVTFCDCRSLAALYSDCDAPRQTCLSFRNGINTAAHRGISKPISKEEAKKVVRDADSAGLMHTANANTICNCCTGCCYLSRARKRRDTELKEAGKSRTSWPHSTKRITIDRSKCIGCGTCESRCPFHLFNSSDKTINRAECVGCSLCVNTCPENALHLEYSVNDAFTLRLS
jgi:Pyruvate/2-oxoacid:ferredoxin oxidoreductase delta subunit